MYLYINTHSWYADVKRQKDFFKTMCFLSFRVLIDVEMPSENKSKKWGKTERRQTSRGGRVRLPWRREQRHRGSPFAHSTISLAGWVTHYCFNASLSGGTPCCPYTSSFPLSLTEMSIAAITKSGLPSWGFKNKRNTRESGCGGTDDLVWPELTRRAV